MKTRQVVPIEDDLFLFEVYASSRQVEMALWSWEEEAQHQFLQMQHYCQQRSYQMQYTNLESNIIISDGVNVGRIVTALNENEIVLVDITILPEFQNKRIGRTLLTKLQNQAAKVGLSVQLSVLDGNSARHLYERVGFQPIASTGPYTIMKWTNSEKI